MYNYPFVSAPCTGKNGEKMQDCTVTRHKDQNPICNGAKGEQPGRNCVPKDNYFPAAVYPSAPSLAQTEYYLPTCTDRDQTNCQQTCTESMTTGCTEAASPNWPEHDRFEGKYTHK